MRGAFADHFFFRAQRRGGILNYVGIVIFTALMIASNFTSTFLIAAEALWLGWLLLARLWDAQSQRLAVLGPACALVAGIAILIPWLPRAVALVARCGEMGSDRLD